jgi:hypothetical protein
MSDRRRFASSVLLTLSLAFLIDWVARGWESLTHHNVPSRTSPAAPAPLGQAVGRAGCGIDPNGHCG